LLLFLLHAIFSC